MIKKINALLFLALFLILSQSHTYCAKKCNDLIILLDPEKNETIEAKSTALGSTFITALQEQAAPILTTINLIKNFCYWKAEHADTLNTIKEVTITYKDNQARDTKVKEIVDSLSPTKKSTFPSFQFAMSLCLIDISDTEWDCYIHKLAGLVLLIPKKYILSHTGNSHALLEECGFNSSEIQKVTIIPLESLLKFINDKEIEEARVDLMTAVKSCFITVPTETTWNIFLVGHGSPAKKKKEFLASKSFIESMYESSQALINGYRSLNDPKRLNTAILQEAKPYVENYHLLQSMDSFNNEDLIPQTAHIAGLSFNEFFELMKMLDQLNTSFFYYTTCFGGGYNRIFMNDILQKLNATFITVSEGYNESPTYASTPQFTIDQSGNVKLSRLRFTNFFQLLNSVFGESIPFGKTKRKQQLKTDPIATIVSSFVNLDNLISNQPFVRIPSIGTFQALTVDKKVKILTHSLVKVYEFENRIIDLTDPNIQAIMVYPEKITVPIKVLFPKFITPTPQSFKKKNIIHIFETITADSWLNFILTNFISLNKSYTKTTFVIKNLQCFNSKNLTTTMNNVINIKNLVIQIASDVIAGMGNIFSTTVKIAFSLDKKDYSFETSFENNSYNTYDLINIFDAPPTHPVNPELLQELANVTDPTITLEGVVKQLESQIDTSTNVQKVGSLKKILLVKKIESLEQGTAAKSIEQQIRWLKKKKKPLTIITDRFKKYEQDLTTLEQHVNTLINEHQLSEQEKTSLLQKITMIKQNIHNVDHVIKEKLSAGYLSQMMENIKETGHDLYEWLFSRK